MKATALCITILLGFASVTWTGGEEARPVARVQLRLLGAVRNAQVAMPIARQGWRVVCVAGESLIWPMTEDWGKMGSVAVTPLQDGESHFAQFVGDLFLYCSKSHLYCVDLITGAIRWSKVLSQGEDYPIAANSDKVLVFANRTIQALSLKDGTVAWTAKTNITDFGFPKADLRGNLVYLAWCRGVSSFLDWILGTRGENELTVCCLNLLDGKQEWSVSREPPKGQAHILWVMPVVAEERLFIVGVGGIQELSVATGSLVGNMHMNAPTVGRIMSKSKGAICTYHHGREHESELFGVQVFRYDINRKVGTVEFEGNGCKACVLDDSIVLFGPQVAIRDTPQGLRKYSTEFSAPLPDGTQLVLKSPEARGIAAFWQKGGAAESATAIYEVLVDYGK